MIIVEDPSGIDQLLKNLEQLAEVVEPGRKVIVIGSINDVQVYRRLVSQGISEYLVGPVSTQEIVEAVLELRKDPALSARLAAGASEFCRQHFNWQKNTGALLEFYQEITLKLKDPANVQTVTASQ